MVHVGVANTFLEFSSPSAQAHFGLCQTQGGREAEYIISGRNALRAGGVWTGFNNDQSHVLLLYPLNIATGKMEERG